MTPNLDDELSPERKKLYRRGVRYCVILCVPLFVVALNAEANSLLQILAGLAAVAFAGAAWAMQTMLNAGIEIWRGK